MSLSPHVRNALVGLLCLLVPACVGELAAGSLDDRDGFEDQMDQGGDGDGDAPTNCLGGDPFDTDKMQSHLAYLASDEMEGRAPGTQGDIKTRNFIADTFDCLELIPGGDDSTFDQRFITSAGEQTGNVVGYIEGTDLAAEIILIGAHHDHLGVVDGQIHNGANDNASGVSALLAIAQAVQQRPTPPRRTIAFVAFGFEEHDGVCEGSEFYARNPPSALPLGGVVYMVDADMLGTYNEGGLTAYGSLQGTPARAALNQLLPAYPVLRVELGESAEQDDSDFQAFCNQGIPYIYFETWDPGCYHEGCDDAQRIDYPSLSLITALLNDVVMELADSSIDLASAVQPGCN